ncbi:O-antigen ligase family protein [bacterium]|nr:O-antigen ligase family protein [bacterium]
MNSQLALSIATCLLVILAWYLWQNWGRAHLIAAGMVGIVAGGILFAYPILGASLAAFLMISNLTEFIPGAVSPLLLLTLGMIIVKKLLAGDAAWTVTPFLKWGLLFVVVHLLSTLWAGSYRFLEWSIFYRVVLIAVILSEVVKTPRDFLIVIIGAQAGAILTGILTVQGAAEFYLTGAADELAGSVGAIESSRFFGIWFEPNTMALSQVPVIGLSLVLLRTKLNFWVRLLSFAAVGAGLITVMLSLSRGAALCTLVMLLAIALADRYRYQIISGVVLLAILVISVLPVDIIGRMTSLTKPGADSSINQRSELLLGGIEMIQESFPFGVGPGNYRLYSMDYASKLAGGMISHNAFIDAFAEAGALGIFLYLGAIFMLYKTLKWRGRKLIPDNLGENLNVGFGAVLIGLTLAMAFLSSAEYPIFWMFYAMTALLPLVFRDSFGDQATQPVLAK